ncbi:MAG: hypothetical protein IJ193_01395 [Bacilli bacterium]|nr:hypothetical protein [Bacilli bacterium]
MYDLDSQRALMYCTLLLDDQSIEPEAEDFLITFVQEHIDQLGPYVINGINLYDEKQIKNIKAFAIHQLKQDLKDLSKIQESGAGLFKSQKAFNLIEPEVLVSNISTSASQMLIGIADAKAFGITNSRDVQEINEDAYKFFKKKLSGLKYNIPAYKVDPTKYDATLYNADGDITLLVVGELHDDRSILQGMRPDTEYRVGEDGMLYNGSEEYGVASGKEFYTIVGKDGVVYKVLYVHSLQDYERFNAENHLYTNRV